MYTWSPMGVAPPSSEGGGEKLPGYLCFKDYNDGVYQHSEIVPSRCIRYTKFFFSRLVQFYPI